MLELRCGIVVISACRMNSSSPSSPASSSSAHYFVPLYRFAFLMTGSAEAAAEIFDHTVESAASHFTEIRCPRRAARWLFAQARANCRKHLRRGRKPAAVPGAHPQSDHNGNNGAHAGDDDSPDSRQHNLERAAEFTATQLAAAFAPLPEPERCALALFYLSLFSTAGLADVLGISLRDLPALLNRGRALLRGHPAMTGLAMTETQFLRC